MKKIDKKRTILICFFLSLFVVGTILIFTTPSSIKITYNQTVETSDGETISFNVFEPIHSEKKKKAVIIGHGIMDNKEFLKGYAIDLACAGFVAVPFDFRGHGQSSGELDYSKLVNDVKAIKAYLYTRGDIDMDSLGIIGYSMGGWPANEIIKDDDDFKCFIGVGTRLLLDEEDYEDNFLNVLIILARYDQAIEVKEVKEGVAERLDVNVNDVKINKRYGSFHDGTATKIIVDENSDHLSTAWDSDFIRATRDWVKNTFPDVDPVDNNFYANIRLVILLIQLIGGIGFFFLIIEPLSDLILKPKESEVFKIELEDKTIKVISIKTIVYSIVLAIPGMLIMLPVFLFLLLPIAGFVLMLLFGMVFGIFILLWRLGKKADMSLSEILKGPFKGTNNKLLREFALGGFLATILYFLLYLSVGLNYLGLIPSMYKILWVPIYLAIGFLMYIILGLLFQATLQAKLEKTLKSLYQTALLDFVFLMVYLSFYILALCFIQGSFFYSIFLIIGVPIVCLAVFVSSILYQKTGNIVAGAIVDAVFFVLLISTLSPFMSGIAYIFRH